MFDRIIDLVDRIIDLFNQEGFLIWTFLMFVIGCVTFGSLVDKLTEMNEPEIVYVQGCAYSLSTEGTKPVINTNGKHVCKGIEHN